MPRCIDKLCSVLRKNPFWISFASLAIIYLLIAVVFYPALFMGDTPHQIVQVYGELKLPGLPYYLPSNQLSPNVFINQHHPVAHSFLIHLFLETGRILFKSFNIGIFLYVLFQLFFFAGVVSFGIKTLIRKKIAGEPACWLLIIYAALHPLILDYIPLVSKDLIYSAFFVLEVLFLLPLIQGDKMVPKDYWRLIFSSVGMLIFRNEAKYILFATFLLILIVNKKARKRAAWLLAFVTVFSGLYYFVLMPAIRATPGSRREMLSVPFQQTARYIRAFDSEVTEEERQAINNVLDYDYIKENYNPYSSDPVKGTFKEDCTSAELNHYFSVWWKMFQKHPGTYIQATMNNYYQYFYPGEMGFRYYAIGWSNTNMEKTNKDMEPLGERGFFRPETNEAWAIKYEKLRNMLLSLPILNCLNCAALYTWILFFLLFYCFHRKIDISALILPFVTLMVCLLGPCNGYYGRYQLPVIVAVPFIFLYIRSGHPRSKAKKEIAS